MSPAPQTSGQYDAIIVGAGHNGLVCAAYLARAKRRVLVLERQSRIGGAAVTAEISPQFLGSACAHLLNGFDPSIISDLRLKRRGLSFSNAPVPLVALAEDGRHIVLGEKLADSVAQIARHSQIDAGAYEGFRKTMLALAAALRPLVSAPPLGLREQRSFARLVQLSPPLDRADRLIGQLDPEARRLLSELTLGPVADVLERSFETPLLQGALAFKACLGNAYGPRSPGSGLAFLLRLAIERDGKRLITAFPKGGLGALADALASSATKAGAVIRTGTNVASILMEGGRATGVRLETGEEIRAPIVVSNADPKQTLTRLLPSGQLGTGFSRIVRGLRSMGLVAKVNLALDSMPIFEGLDIEAMGGRLVVAPSIAAIEDALSEVQTGRYSSEPVMEITVPTIHDPELAPAGKHVMSVIVQYAPYDTNGGWADQRDHFAERVLGVIERYAPAIRNHVLAGDVMSPADLERNYGLPQGNWHHIEPAPDQMFWLRPAPGAEAHATPVAGLYLCGVGTHPAGDITGIAGRNAARVILAAEAKR